MPVVEHNKSALSSLRFNLSVLKKEVKNVHSHSLRASHTITTHIFPEARTLQNLPVMISMSFFHLTFYLPDISFHTLKSICVLPPSGEVQKSI